MEIFNLIGAIAGIASIFSVLLLVGVWKGKVDADRALWNQTCVNYPPAELWMMCKTLWDVYVIDILHQRPDVAEQKSSWKLKPQAETLIPDSLKARLESIAQNNCNVENIANGWLVVKYIGIDNIETVAKGNNVSMQEMIAILSLYLDGHMEKFTRGR